MTETMGSSAGATAPGGASGSSSGGAASTRDVAKDQAQGVAQDALEGGKQTADTAKQQAAEVAGEAKDQTRALIDQTRSELSSQGIAQQQRAATGLRSVADELTGMVNGNGGSGIAADLARQASDRVRTAADWLENREPADLLYEVRRFARQRPGTFLAAMAAIGFVGGRVTRGAADEARENRSGQGTGAAYPGYSTGYATDYASSDYQTAGVGTGAAGTTGVGSAGLATGTASGSGLGTEMGTQSYSEGTLSTATGTTTPAASSHTSGTSDYAGQGPSGDDTATFGVTTPGSGVGQSGGGALIEDPAGEDRIGGRRSGEDPI